MQQFATFKAAEPYQHMPTPALEPSDVLSSLSGPLTRNMPGAPVRQRDRSVDIFEKHTLTKPRIDADGQPFTFKTGAAAEFEKSVMEEKTIKILDLPLGRGRRGNAVNARGLSVMNPKEVGRMEEKMKEALEIKERIRERGEAARTLMGDSKSSSSPLPSPRGDGIWGLATRARERSRSGSRNRWEQSEVVASGLEGRQKRRSLTVMTDAVVESDEEEGNPRTGRLGARF